MSVSPTCWVAITSAPAADEGQGAPAASEVAGSATPPQPPALPQPAPAAAAPTADGVNAVDGVTAASGALPSHHATPFSAIAALLAGCLQRADKSGERDLAAAAAGTMTHQAVAGTHQQRRPVCSALPAGATYAHVDMLIPAPPEEQQQPILLVEDDAAGLSPQLLRRSLGVPQRANAVRSAAARSGVPASWPDFVHAAMRLGSAVLVLTNRRQQGASVGLLSCSAADDGGSTVQAWVLDYAADGSRQLAAGSSSTGAADAAVAWQAALEAICEQWPEAGSEEQLQQQLGAMPEQGTRVLVARRRARGGSGCGTPAAGGELDWVSDPADLLQQSSGAADADASAGSSQGTAAGASQGTAAAAAAAAGHAAGQLQQLPPPQQQQREEEKADSGVARFTALHRSLRAYMALLFLRWPDGFRLRLRGTDVTHQHPR